MINFSSKIFFILSALILFGYANLYSQWVQQTSGTANQINDVHFSDANNGGACGISSTILHTTNGGVNWTVQANTTGTNLWGIYFIDANTGEVVGDGIFARTTNGGASWINQSPPGGGLYRGITFADANTGFAVGSNGIVQRTTNGGVNWSVVTTGVTEFLLDPGFANVNTGYVTGLNGVLIKTTNGGDNWTSLNSGVTAHLLGIAVVDVNAAYISTGDGEVLKTTNGGTTWTVQTMGATDALNDIFFVSATTGTAVGGSNLVYRTTNGGANWLLQDPIVSGIGFNGVHFVSNTNGFSVGSTGTIIHTVTGGFSFPAAPVLQIPFNGAADIPLTQTLDWDTVPTAKTYDLQLSTDSTFPSGNIIDTTLLVNTQLPIGAGRLLNNVRYYWRVRGVNIVGNGPWSVIFHFTTVVALPNAPVLLLPVNNASNVGLTPNFDWDSTSPASFYRIQVCSDTTFAQPENDVTGILFSNYTIITPPLQSNTRYYWRVSTTNAAGTGPWSSVFTFTTIITLPQAPILVSPPNNSGNIPLTPILDWRDDITATNYQVQISEDSLFTGTPLWDTSGFNISQVQVRSGLLVNLVKYYWRVRTTNSIGTGPYATPWNFFTGLVPPAAPVLLAPPNGAADISTIVTLDWNNVPYAATYKIQISIDSTFGTSFSASGLSISQFTTPGGLLANNTQYFWRVNATNAAGTGPYSAIWKFRTVISAPIAAPNLLSPANGAIVSTLTPVLDWNDVAGVTGYKIQLALNDSLFINPILDSTLTPSQVTVPAGRLNGNTTYYWRARGINVGGFGPWSSVWHFTTSTIGINLISTIIPKEYQLYNNYPNPFNPSTKIRFDIPSRSHVRIVIFDLLGKEISVLADDYMSPGTYEAVWNALNVASGLYFCRIETEKFTAVKKLLFVK